MQRCNFWSVNKKLYRFCFLPWKSCTFAPFNFGNVQGKCFQIFWSFYYYRSSTSPCPEGSFSAPEIGRLFGDAVGASLVAMVPVAVWPSFNQSFDWPNDLDHTSHAFPRPRLQHGECSLNAQRPYVHRTTCKQLPFGMERPTPIKDAAVHRLAKSITQLTLCQVTTSEVDDATKLLEKARSRSFKAYKTSHPRGSMTLRRHS